LRKSEKDVRLSKLRWEYRGERKQRKGIWEEKIDDNKKGQTKKHHHSDEHWAERTNLGIYTHSERTTLLRKKKRYRKNQEGGEKERG